MSFNVSVGKKAKDIGEKGLAATLQPYINNVGVVGDIQNIAELNALIDALIATRKVFGFVEIP